MVPGTWFRLFCPPPAVFLFIITRFNEVKRCGLLCGFPIPLWSLSLVLLLVSFPELCQLIWLICVPSPFLSAWIEITLIDSFQFKSCLHRPVCNNWPTQVTNDCCDWKDGDVSCCCQQVNSIPDAKWLCVDCHFNLTPVSQSRKAVDEKSAVETRQRRFLNFITEYRTTTFMYKE